MKIIPFITFTMICSTAFGAINWWDQDTICTIDDTRCYAKSTPGIDDTLEFGWDVSAGCRGKKYICPDALTSNVDEPIAMERADIINGTSIARDFDIDVYVADGNCYGARKSKSGGTMVSVDGKYVRVWCHGVLATPTEELSYGDVTNANQPTCKELASDGYAAVLDGKCYGKYYSPEKYAIDCDGETPSLVLLNGANYDPAAKGKTQSDANSAFATMFSASERQRSKHFNR